MQFKETLVRLYLIIFPILSFSQTTYLPQDAKENILLERLEIKQINGEVPYDVMNKPFSRKVTTNYVERVDSLIKSGRITLSRVDQHNVQSFLLNNLEWVSGPHERFASKKSIGRFYRTPANLFEVHQPDFSFIVNPVFQFTLGKEPDTDETLFLNSRGVAVRGLIAKKIAFAASIIDNQERDPLYVRQYADKYDGVPGAGYYKNFKTNGYDYFDARGYFSFGATKYIDISFGYDRNFIGDGYRSLFLSDFSANTLFLKLNTRIWRLNYQNLFMELHTAEPRGPDRLLPKKYAALHHLDVNITRWLNIGLFEGVIFGRKNRFEFGYLNPVIFYRSAEQQNGSFDNSVAGIDFKANIRKSAQLYGQFLLDEFNLQQIKNGDGWWANKWALQLGVKYPDAFSISNLDLQIEHNRARPFTYSHRDSVANYTHYNQPLAHPLGASFSEFIGIARYQPAPKWTALAKLFFWKNGSDTGSRNFGNNIFRPNTPAGGRVGDYGYDLISGIETKTVFLSVLLSYELKENFFIEASLTGRNFQVPSITSRNDKTTVITAGVRWNVHRRNFEF